MKTSIKNMNKSRFFCTQCGKEAFPVFRPKSKSRETGHLKKLFCLYCNEEVNCVELAETNSYTREDFELEFDNFNFNPDGTRVQTLNQLKAAIRNGELDYYGES